MSQMSSTTNKRVLKPASAWLLEDPAYFTGWMRIQIQNTKESTSEASWYGPWTSVLTKGLLQTQIARDEWIELCPQKDIVILEYPEDPLEDDNADPSARPVTRELTRATGNVADQMESLSIAGSSTSRADSISATFTNPNAINSSSGPLESSVHRGDLTRFPDLMLILHWVPQFLPPDQCVYVVDAELRSIYMPYSGVLMLTEIKRPQPPDSSTEGLDWETHWQEEYEQEILNTLDNSMRKQIYQQVRSAFAQYRLQDRILHLSAVGQYCKLRWFNRRWMTEKGLIPMNDNNRDMKPQWAQLTQSDGSLMMHMMREEGQGIHPQIKGAITMSLNHLRDVMSEKHKKDHSQQNP